MQILHYHQNLWAHLSPIWSSLLAMRLDASVYFSKAWIENWLEIYGERIQPEALIWRDAAGIPIAACLVNYRKERRGPFTVQRAYLNASGDHEVGCEHNMILCAPDAEPQVVAELMAHLRERNTDALVLRGFRSDPVDAIKTAWPQAGCVEGYASDDHFVSLDKLREQGKPFLATVSRNTRSQIRRSMRLYEERYGPAHVEVASSTEQALKWFATLRKLHNFRWHARGSKGAFTTVETQRFNERLIEKYATTADDSKSPAIDIVRVSFGEIPVGFLYNLRHRGIVSFYQSGFCYDEDNRLKPGLVTHALAIQHYLDTGAQEYDFLAGEPDRVQYKESLSSCKRPLMWLELNAATPKMRLLTRLVALKKSLLGKKPPNVLPDRQD